MAAIDTSFASNNSSSAYSWYTACDSLSLLLDEQVQLQSNLPCHACLQAMTGAQEHHSQKPCAEHQGSDVLKPCISPSSEEPTEANHEPPQSKVVRGLKHSGQSTPLPELMNTSPIYCRQLQTITPPVSMDVPWEDTSSKVRVGSRAVRHAPVPDHNPSGPKDACRSQGAKRTLSLDIECLQKAIARHNERATTAAANGKRLQYSALYSPVTTTMHTTMKLQGLPDFSQQEFYHVTNKLRSDIETAVARAWPGARISSQIYQEGCIFVAMTLVGVITPFLLMRSRRASQATTFTDRHSQQHGMSVNAHRSSDASNLQQHVQQALDAACSDGLHTHANGKTVVSSAVQTGPALPLPTAQHVAVSQQEQRVPPDVSQQRRSQTFVDAAMNLLSNDMPGHQGYRTSTDSAVHMGWSSNPDNLNSSSSSMTAFAANAISAPHCEPQNRRRSSSAVRGFSGVVYDVDLQRIDEYGTQLPSLNYPDKSGTASVAQPHVDTVNIGVLSTTAQGQLLLWPECPYLTITGEDASGASAAPTVLSLRLSSVQSLKQQGRQVNAPATTGARLRSARVLVIQGNTVLCQKTIRLPSNISTEDFTFNLPVPVCRLKPGSATVLVFEELAKDTGEREVHNMITDYGRNPPAFFELTDVAKKLNILAVCTVGCFSPETCSELQQLWEDMQSEVADQWCTDIHDMPPPQRLLSALAWCHSYAPFLSDIQLLIEGPAHNPDRQSDYTTGNSTSMGGTTDEQQYQGLHEWKEAAYSVLAFMASRNMQATATEVLQAANIELRCGGQPIQGLPFDINELCQPRGLTSAPAGPVEHDGALHNIPELPFIYDQPNETLIFPPPSPPRGGQPSPSAISSARNHSTGQLANVLHALRLSQESVMQNGDIRDAISSQSQTAPSLPLSAPISHTSTMHSACSTVSKLGFQTRPNYPPEAVNDTQPPTPTPTHHGTLMPTAEAANAPSHHSSHSASERVAKATKPSVISKALCCFSVSTCQPKM